MHSFVIRYEETGQVIFKSCFFSKLIGTLTFVGSPEGSGYISMFSFLDDGRFVKLFTRSDKSFPFSIVANNLREVQKKAWSTTEEADKSQNSSCSITWPLIWFKVNLECTLTIKSPPTPAIKDLGFPVIVHLILRILVDSIIISCTVYDSQSM